MKKWDDLPNELKCKEVKPYYDILMKRKAELFMKRIFDILVSGSLIILLSPVIGILSVWIKMDSKGPVFFRQKRITIYGRTFAIFKFRTMVQYAENIGSQVTKKNDMRITRVGAKIRNLRLDEIPQIFNVFLGDMSLVGTRPEVSRYVKHYTNEMKATLLMPAGVTSRASIEYKDEDKILEFADDVDAIYINEILPEKMKYNLQELKKFSLISEFKIMLQTITAIWGNRR